MSPKLSIIIIARNEEEMIGECLESIRQLADEIVFLDGGSTDNTLEIVKKYSKARIIRQKVGKMDYGAWHNQGAKEAKGEWILYVDADERITPELQKEILSVISTQLPVIGAYAIPRQNILLGKRMKYGGWYPDYQIRLFRKSHLEGWEGSLHERPIFSSKGRSASGGEGELGYLKQPMLHITHRDLSSMVEKTRQWSKIEAELLYKARHPPVVWWRIIRVMLTEFWHRAVKLQGWRDGTVGWIEIIFQMFSRFITYARLWELQQIKKEK